uniref:Uncharacterized protein n=1 Tax=Micrurus spixii TaxID=129469 RepID=A0A2D4LYH0_9SAUR
MKTVVLRSYEEQLWTISGHLLTQRRNYEDSVYSLAPHSTMVIGCAFSGAIFSSVFLPRKSVAAYIFLNGGVFLTWSFSSSDAPIATVTEFVHLAVGLPLHLPSTIPSTRTFSES